MLYKPAGTVVSVLRCITLNLRHADKGQVKEGAASRAPTPKQLFHDPTNTVTTNASAANTFNEEVDERSIIPVGDQITLQQLSGAPVSYTHLTLPTKA